MRAAPLLCLALFACSGGAPSDAGADAAPIDAAPIDAATGTPRAGHFTYAVESRVFRIEARVGAVAEDVSAALERFGAGTRDRWLAPSPDATHLALSTDRLACSLGECLAVAPWDLSSIALVKPAGAEVSLQGIPAVLSAGSAVVYPSQEGPHEVDLWITRRGADGSWGAATLLTGGSTYAHNNMPALSFDERRVLFDCGTEPYPESGGNHACEVGLDGGGFRVVARPDALAGSRNDYLQFPHDSLDGVLVQGSWPVAGETPEIIWLVPAAGAPTPLGRMLDNSVSPCGLRDGRFGVLWLGRPGNASGAHELTLVARDGAPLGALTPGVDVSDIGVGCSD